MAPTVVNGLEVKKDNLPTLKHSHSIAAPQFSSLENSETAVENAGGLVPSYHPLIDRMQQHIQNRDPFFSLEFFPPRTKVGLCNFLARLERFQEGRPLFVDITWHPAGNPNSTLATSSSSVAHACLNFCYHETMLHMTCAMYTREQAIHHLQRARALGIRNIMALRGDLPDSQAERDALPNELPYATDMVRLIRQEFGDYFVVAVAGYPNGHPDSTSYEDDIKHLKEKIDAGADFVVTQLIFRASDFVKFEKDCRKAGINVPIIPGVMPIQSYDSLRHMVKLTKLEVPKFIFDAVEPLKGNDEAIQNYGIAILIDTCRILLSEGCPGIHFYTLNKEHATREALKGIGLWNDEVSRPLPWKVHHGHHVRCQEEIRPIFWQMRPKSYVFRTQDWEEFPSARWQNNPNSFNQLTDYYKDYLRPRDPAEPLRAMWGEEIRHESDVWRVFSNFIKGDKNAAGVKVTKTPWNSGDNVLPETSLIKQQLIWANDNGFLTINSQPSVNGASSEDPVLGWGRAGGYIYRKAYLEFFTNRETAEILLELLPSYPLLNYHIINHDGSVDITNLKDTPVAVTWGVFPGSEIQQPTIVEAESFRVWKDEAFGDWLHIWSPIYSHDPRSQQTLQSVHDRYCLVNLVDNEYVRPSTLIWDLLYNVGKLATQRSYGKANSCASVANGQLVNGSEKGTKAVTFN